MFAIVKDGVITRTGLSFRQLFPNTSFPSNGPNSAFRSENGVMEVVNAKQKNRAYYYVTQGDIVLVDGVPTQQYTNTAKRLVDEDAKDSDGKQLYVQVKNSDGDWVANPDHDEIISRPNSRFLQLIDEVQKEIKNTYG